MKAVSFKQHGDVSVLEYSDFPDPVPGPEEVIVRLRSAALNRLDIWVRNGWPGIKLEYPHIPGADGAGDITAIGQDVTDWSMGDRVVINANLGCGKCDNCLAGMDNLCHEWNLVGETVRGTYAEYIKVHSRQLFRIPEDFEYHRAAAAGLVYQTAWHSLVERGQIRYGETVLIIGSSGGVNTASIQIAKYFNATVIAIGAGKEKTEFARCLGADIVIDRLASPDWVKEVARATDRKGVDIVVDNVGSTFPSSFRALKKGGRLLTVGNTGGPKFEIDNRYIFGKHLTIIGSTMGTRQDFISVMELVTRGKLMVAVDRSFPLADVRAAHLRLEKGQQLGKITLDIS
ncbi:MAG: zinc-binding dehydrogenase [Chloroflexota bacterium]